MLETRELETTELTETVTITGVEVQRTELAGIEDKTLTVSEDGANAEEAETTGAIEDEIAELTIEGKEFTIEGTTEEILGTATEEGTAPLHK